jgi:tryptophan synthase alpha chain
MRRIEKLFKEKKPYIGYLTAGDGGMERTLLAATALVKGGVDLLEVGIPFTDPIADGPVIQEAMERSLSMGTTPNDVLLFIQKFRKSNDVPIVLFSYYNPILKGGKQFLEKAVKAGVDGILIVDLSIEEGEEFQKEAQIVGLDTIFLVAPSTPESRIEKIANASSGFIYYASSAGTTGMKTKLPNDLTEKVSLIKSSCNLPVVVGFGISNSDMTKQILKVADGFVVGSYFVDAIGKGKTAEELTKQAKELIS